MQDGDVVFVNPRGKTVKVSGEVNRTAIFELKVGENFDDLKRIFGGFKSTTYMKRARLDRILDFEDRLKLKTDRRIVDINLMNLELEKPDKTIPVNDGDVFTFFKISDFQTGIVSIRGPLKRPGEYSIGSGLKITGLISKADGFSNSDIYRERLEVMRTNSDGTQDLITVNLDSVLAGLPNHDIELRNSDVVQIFSLSNRLYKNNVSISGYVLKPFASKLIKGMTVFDLIFKGGGFENKERLENTYMERADLVRVSDNLYDKELVTFRLDSVLAGLGIANMQLKMGDKIKIYSKKEIFGQIDSKVEISGYVKKPGTYIRTEGMRVSELLFRGSGLEDSSHVNKLFYGRADLVRISDDLLNKYVINLELKDLIEDGENDLELKNGDRLIVYSKEIYESFSSQVSISGAIKKSGNYEIFENMRLGDLILYAGGVDISIKKFNVEISNVIDEINYKQRGPVRIANINSFNLKNNKELYFGNDKNNALNYILRPNDNIIIYTNELNRLRKVSISGEVLFEGQYVLETDEDDIYEIINRAGGITKSANERAGTIIRNGQTIKTDFSKFLKNKRSKYNLKLSDGDRITIPAKTGLVKITGAVMVPGVYQHFENDKLIDYIKEAGGFDKKAAKLSTIVTHLNGKTERIRLIGKGPKIYDGSIISVKYKEEVQPFNFTQFATNITSIYADFVQAIAVISIIGRN